MARELGQHRAAPRDEGVDDHAFLLAVVSVACCGAAAVGACGLLRCLALTAYSSASRPLRAFTQLRKCRAKVLGCLLVSYTPLARRRDESANRGVSPQGLRLLKYRNRKYTTRSGSAREGLATLSPHEPARRSTESGLRLTVAEPRGRRWRGLRRNQRFLGRGGRLRISKPAPHLWIQLIRPSQIY